MTSEPDRSDPQFEQHVEHLCKAPGMFVIPATYGAVCGYLCGFDDARNNGPLVGFREWLVVRFNDGNNLVWYALARHLIPSGLTAPDDQSIRELGVLLSEFFHYRRTHGTTKIFYDYGKWLLRRSWYTGPLRPKDKNA